MFNAGHPRGVVHSRNACWPWQPGRLQYHAAHALHLPVLISVMALTHIWHQHGLGWLDMRNRELRRAKPGKPPMFWRRKHHVDAQYSGLLASVTATVHGRLGKLGRSACRQYWRWRETNPRLHATEHVASSASQVAPCRAARFNSLRCRVLWRRLPCIGNRLPRHRSAPEYLRIRPRDKYPQKSDQKFFRFQSLDPCSA